MDIKRGKSGKLRRKRTMAPSRGIRLNEMFYEAQWTLGGLSSSTAGAIANSSLSATIQNSSEYSGLAAIFTEVKLVRCSFRFTAQQATNPAVLHGRVMIGTNMIFTAVTHTTPTSFLSVQNLEGKSEVPTFMTRAFTYSLRVPRGLEFSNITADSPSSPTPWAGSPGCAVIYGDDFTVSTTYLLCDGKARWILRGRQ